MESGGMIAYFAFSVLNGGGSDFLRNEELLIGEGPNELAKPGERGGKVVWRGIFVVGKKRSGTAPGMILKSARGGELRVGCSSLKAWWRTWKLADQSHRLMTAGQVGGGVAGGAE